jgi:hypothetical protein
MVVDTRNRPPPYRKPIGGGQQTLFVLLSTAANYVLAADRDYGMYRRKDDGARPRPFALNIKCSQCSFRRAF